MGQVLCRLISNVKCSQKSEGGVRLKTYSGICLRDVPKNPSMELIIPDYVSFEHNENEYILSIPKDIIRNGTLVEFIFKIDKKKLDTKVFVLDKEIDIQKYGLNPKSKMDQIWLNGLISIVDCMKLCHGLNIKLEGNSKRPIIHHWSKFSESSKNTEERSHSKKCSIILPFISPHSSNNCKECVQDLHSLHKYIENKKSKKRKLEVEIQTEASLSTESVDIQTDEDPDCIYLNKLDHDDLVNILKKLIKAAPKFSDLLRCQLKNATSADPRHQRWDENILSLCLNLWAK